MFKILIAIALILGSVTTAFASTNHTGSYICENGKVEGIIDLDETSKSIFMRITMTRKDNGEVREFSGATHKSYLGDKDITFYTLGNNKLWFNANGSIEYNKSIVCDKN